MSIDNRPIGIFDSGIGGLSVLKQLRQLLPNEHFIYVADNKNSPFGDKSVEEILQINDNVITFLQGHDVKAIVIACNTSSSLALDHDKQQYKVPFIDMLQDGLWFTSELEDSTNIGIIATQATVNSNSYKRIIKQYNSNLKIEQIASPKLVPLIEKHLYDTYLKQTKQKLDKSLQEAIMEYITPFKNAHILILGCSHYPFVINYIATNFTSLKIVDPSYYVAIKTQELISRIGVCQKSSPSTFCYTKENKTLLKNASNFGFKDYSLITLPLQHP